MPTAVGIILGFATVWAVALILFVLRAFNVASKVDLVAAGLACCVASVLVPVLA